MNGRELTADDVVYNFERWRTSDQNTRLDELPYESITATDRTRSKSSCRIHHSMRCWC